MRHVVVTTLVGLLLGTSTQAWAHRPFTPTGADTHTFQTCMCLPIYLCAEGFQAPGVVVSFTTDPDIQNGSKFKALGYQIAAGVPLQVGEGAEFRTFRLGLFGLDKLKDVDATVARLKTALDQVL